MRNGEKILVEVIETYRLILDIGYHLDMMDTFYVPSIISLMLLDTLLSLEMVVLVYLSVLI